MQSRRCTALTVCTPSLCTSLKRSPLPWPFLLHQGANSTPLSSSSRTAKSRPFPKPLTAQIEWSGTADTSAISPNSPKTRHARSSVGSAPIPGLITRPWHLADLLKPHCRSRNGSPPQDATLPKVRTLSCSLNRELRRVIGWRRGMVAFLPRQLNSHAILLGMEGFTARGCGTETDIKGGSVNGGA